MSVTIAAVKAAYDLPEPDFHQLQECDPEGFQALLDALTAVEVAYLLNWLDELGW